MKKTIKKILAGLLAVLMLAGNTFALPSVVTTEDSANEITKDLPISFEVDEEGTTIIDYSNVSPKIETESDASLLDEYPYPALLDYSYLESSFISIAKSKILPIYQDYVLNAIKYHIESSTKEYRVAKNLLQLYNAGQDGTVLFFFDGCSVNLDGATYTFSGYKKNGNRYNTSAVCIVLQLNSLGKPEIVYATSDASTMADNVRNSSLNGGTDVSITKDGIYNILTTNHKGYAALNLQITTGASLRCPKSGKSYSATASGINIHARSFSSDAITTSTYSSTGCFNVGTHKSQNDHTDYNNFIYSVTGVSNARNNSYPSNGVSSGLYKGIAIVDRSNYKTQLATIFGDDTSGYTGSEIASIITEASIPWNTEINTKYSNLDTEKPVVSNVQITDVSDKGYTVTCTVSDNVGVEVVRFPTWTLLNDQDDLVFDWVNNSSIVGNMDGNGNVTFRVNTSDHNNEFGSYVTDIYAFDKNGNSSSTRIGAEIKPDKSPEIYLNGQSDGLKLTEGEHTISYTAPTNNLAEAVVFIYKDGEMYYNGSILSAGTYARHYPAGEYEAYIHLTYSYGYNCYTNTIKWIVDYPLVPTDTGVFASATEIESGDTINFTFGVYGARQYKYSISDGTDIIASADLPAGTNTFSYTFENPGTYTISSSAHNNVNSMELAELTVSVTKKYVASFSTSMQAYLNLEGLISMSVGYKFADMDSINPEDYLDSVGLLVWEADEAPEEAEATYDNCTNILEGARYNSALGRFETTTEGIVAKKLGDQLCFRAYCLNEDGSYSYSKYITNYSPKTYCYNQITKNSDDEVTVELMASILNYGAAAQKYFKYRTDDLMNADLPEELK